MDTKSIHLIAAARPNFMKVAPLFHELIKSDWARPVLVHTGQHYDHNMSAAILDDLGLPDADFHLGVGSGTHAEQTGKVMIAYEKVCLEQRPDWIVVVGDVNSTVACALVGAKLGIPVVHLEAGLRSRDRSMPEEINRLATDAISDVLWTPSEDADENLLGEGIPQEKITLVGNIMIDSYEMMRERIDAAGTRETLGLNDRDFGVVTMHRPSNVDQPETLSPIVDALLGVGRRLPLVFVAHPRTIKNLKAFGLYERLTSAAGFRLIEPLSYIPFMSMVTDCRIVITDSGGLQEETTYLGIPCLTLRDNTERPITITHGSNKLVNAASLQDSAEQALSGNWPTSSKPRFWDGQTARRSAADLRARSQLD